ncbi:unnamed protein product [Orchesella dallaii]|uniref:Uncharacterized protein n=1 Tax=Orchesella dallaii TaxID=48710 RepID=A0ABP1PPM0_9HEXA
MPVPDDMWLYCGISALVMVILCCCFHVTELIKLRYLRKLTSADRFSLSGFSADGGSFSEAGSRSSTRRNTVVDTESGRPTTAASSGEARNFSIFTVITYASSQGSSRPFEMEAATATSTLNPKSNTVSSERVRTSLEELFDEISCTPAERSDRANTLNGKRLQKWHQLQKRCQLRQQRLRLRYQLQHKWRHLHWQQQRCQL